MKRKNVVRVTAAIFTRLVDVLRYFIECILLLVLVR
jgi:hypothetical protein